MRIKDTDLNIIRFKNVPWHRAVFDDEYGISVALLSDIRTLLQTVILEKLNSGDIVSTKLLLEETIKHIKEHEEKRKCTSE